MARKSEAYKAVIGYDYVAEGARRFLEGSEQVQAALKRTEVELEGLGPASAGGVRRLTSQMDMSQREIEQTALGVRDLRAELERLDNMRVEPVIDVQQTGGGRGVGNALDSLGSAGSVGSQLASGLGNSDASNFFGLVGDLSGALTSLSPPMILLTGAGIGLSAVVGDVAANFEAGRLRAEAFNATFGSTIDQIAAGATSSDIRQEIATADASRQARERTRDELQGLVEEYLAIPNTFDAASVDLREKTAQMLSDLTGISVSDITIPTIQASIAQLNTEINNFSTSAATNRAILNSGATAANDNTRALNNFVAAGEGVLDLIQRNIDLSLEQAEATRREIVDKQKLIVVTEEAAEATRRAAQQIAVTNATGEYFEALEKVGTATSSVTKAEQSLLEARDDQAARENKLRSDTADAVNEAEESAAEARVKLAETTGEEVNRITRRFNADYKNAQGFRDALAAHLAKQRADEELTDQREGASKQEREIEKSLTKQLQTISKNYNKQFAEVQQSGAKEINQRRQTLQQAQVDLVNAKNAENATRKQFYATEQNLLVTNYQQQQAIHEAGMIKIKDALVRQYQDALQWGGGKTPNMNKGAMTTINSSSRPVINAPITINGSNMSPKQVEQTVLNSLGRLISMVPIR